MRKRETAVVKVELRWMTGIGCPYSYCNSQSASMFCCEERRKIFCCAHSSRCLAVSLCCCDWRPELHIHLAANYTQMESVCLRTRGPLLLDLDVLKLFWKHLNLNLNSGTNSFSPSLSILYLLPTNCSILSRWCISLTQLISEFHVSCVWLIKQNRPEVT